MALSVSKEASPLTSTEESLWKDSLGQYGNLRLEIIRCYTFNIEKFLGNLEPAESKDCQKGMYCLTLKKAEILFQNRE